MVGPKQLADFYIYFTSVSLTALLASKSLTFSDFCAVRLSGSTDKQKICNMNYVFSVVTLTLVYPQYK